MANMFDVRVPSALEALMAGRAGYDTGRQFAQDQATRAAAPDIASGNYQSAIAQLMGAGNTRDALALVALQNNNRDFQFRQQEAQRAQGNTDRVFSEGQRQFNIGQDATRVPPGFEPDPTKPGSLRPRQGGPQDPAYIQETRKGPNLSVSDITKLSDEGGKFANIGGFIQNFRPEYGGKLTASIGEVSNAVARNAPSWMTGANERAAADWWSSYQSYKNVVRNDLFGSALTATEKGEFEKADINPGMNPELIAKNLQRQQEIVQRGIARKAGALVEAGHNAQVISKAYGLTPEQLGVSTKKGGAGPVKISNPQERDALAPGTQYIAPDGSLRTKQ